MVAGVELDGRRARRARGRLAVMDAMLELVDEGHLPPSAEQLATRSGLSVASIFRYFDTLDDLRRATTEVFFERSAPLFEVPGLGEGTLATRIANLVAARVRLYETNEGMARLVRLRAQDLAEADEIVHRLRAARADQVRGHFAPELDAMTPARRDDTVVVVSTLTSFESWDQARHHHRRSAAQIRRAWTGALGSVLRP